VWLDSLPTTMTKVFHTAALMSGRRRDMSPGRPALPSAGRPGSPSALGVPAGDANRVDEAAPHVSFSLPLPLQDMGRGEAVRSW